ncbi:hypothetical protein BAUCODRAFT_126620 [Baudoinia panamericana UAMH 10762]|uniref:tRNA-splicing endonuclease subunit Sen34 n=1 Tax=Baudoinia panamericana (strain UAMH 10762) TaxID=717646 RepID=M2LCE9_BAUPA|nr:uncharacterized protein BAUCODRAFT_126620 [Baudoinia panamericana UAMH 10762]EMC91622.1 hypothetical protein BAUCODRAFT_126620 [Baudoinia panamericana UAMH 10762]
MANSDAPTVSEPFPIFELANRYLLYDVNTITYIRAKYNIPGVLIGGLPQAPQQNVFSGIPLELMPEEARLLCEKGVAYVVDDARAHKQGFLDRGLSVEERKRFAESLRKQGQAAASKVKEKAEDKKQTALRQIASGGDWNDLPEDMLKPPSRPTSRAANKKKAGRPPLETGGLDEDESLFASPMNSFPKPAPTSGSRVNPPAPSRGLEPHTVTPTTSYPPLTAAPPPLQSSLSTSRHYSLGVDNSAASARLPEAPSSYPLYKDLHEKGYFILPGIRFGCKYMAYPGDTLRFHSHFLCNSKEWDEEFDMLDLVAGGRLATSVKKGWLMGGMERPSKGGAGLNKPKVRSFTIEWGGM